jgi:hypothetical protein
VKRLGYLAQRDEELSLIRGNGTIPAHLGLLNAADSTETATTVARGGDNIPTAVAHLIEETFSQSGLYPTWTLMNPLRWLEYMTLRGDAGTNSYIAGYPSRDATNIFSLWGTRVAISKAVPQDDIIVGSEAAASRWVHTSGMKVEASPFYSTFFGEGRVLVRAKIRTALAYDYASGIGVLNLGS